MANEKNLRPIKKGELSKEEAKRRGSLGGKRSVQAKKEYKTLQDLTKMLLSKPMTSKLKKTIETDFPELNAEEMTIGAALIVSQIKSCLAEGNTKAFLALRDTSGEKPVERIATTDSDGNDVTTIVFEGVEPTTPQNVGNGG